MDLLIFVVMNLIRFIPDRLANVRAQVAALKCQLQIILIFKLAVVSWMPWSNTGEPRTIGY